MVRSPVVIEAMQVDTDHFPKSKVQPACVRQRRHAGCTGGISDVKERVRVRRTECDRVKCNVARTQKLFAKFALVLRKRLKRMNSCRREDRFRKQSPRADMSADVVDDVDIFRCRQLQQFQGTDIMQVKLLRDRTMQSPLSSSIDRF